MNSEDVYRVKLINNLCENENYKEKPWLKKY